MHPNQMPSDDKKKRKTDVLSLAALFNGEFSIDWIQELTGLKASQILLDLNKGVKLSWLTQKSPDVFFFSDPQIQQERSITIHKKEREQWHHQIADLLSRHASNDLERLQAMAHHLLQTTSDFRNCQALVQTGHTLYKAFRQNDALQCYTKAILDLKSIKGKDADRLFVDVALRYCRVFPLERDQWIISVIKEAGCRAKGSDTKPFKALLKMYLAHNEWLNGRYSLAIKYYGEGWTTAQAEGNPRILREALTLSMFFLWGQSRYRDFIELYKKNVPEIDESPTSKVNLLVTSMLGSSYVFCGQVTQGLGILHGLHDHCRKLEIPQLLGSEPPLGLAMAFIEIGRIDEAIQIIEEIMEKRGANLTPFNVSNLHTLLAQAHGEKKDLKKAMHELKIASDFVSRSSDLLSPIGCKNLIPFALAGIADDLLSATGISLEKIVKKNINNADVFEKGMAYFLKAILLKEKKQQPKDILKALLLSKKWVKESGHELQLAKIRLTLARTYLMIGDEKNARNTIRKAYAILAPIDRTLIPEDLVPLIKDMPVQENLLDAILKLGQEIVAIRDHRELVQHILTTINQLTSAERGAIFLVKDDSDELAIELEAARVLTIEDIEHKSFKPSMKIIRKTITSGVGQIMYMEPSDNQTSLLDDKNRGIRSCFCVPMVLRNKMIGVLYHDNRLMTSSVKESDLEILSYFAGWAAIALDNARAYEEIQRLNQQLNEEKEYYREQHLQSLQYEEFVGASPAIKRTLGQIEQVAPTDTTVLILGETGVGKELVARVIHRISKRNGRPFIRVDCSALPETLITSELFGHEKGAFTGAVKHRAGRFELANHGTLFLDEIGNIPMEFQNRLLRILETREFQRVGGEKTIHSDFRLLTATNENLQEAVKSGRFREDLFYRLNVFPITVPPLRERKEDIPPLAYFFLKNYASRMGKPLEKISKSAMEKLLKYPWPGNVRELENVMERGAILSTGSHFSVPELLTGEVKNPQKTDSMTLEENERHHILRILEKTDGKIQGKGGAAKLLGIHHNTLHSRMKKLGIMCKSKMYQSMNK